MKILGIDEAGRGCVLGPLVVGAFLVDEARVDALWQAGAADSKQIPADRRLEVRDALEPLGTAQVHRIEPEAIDNGNLNRLEEAVIARIVAETQPDRVIVDALGHPRTLPATVARLREAAACDCEWVMEPKADVHHAPVAAASIFAKTTRDAAIDALAESFGELGSGYPHDPRTRAWLVAWSDGGEPWPAFVRTRWATIDALAQRDLF